MSSERSPSDWLTSGETRELLGLPHINNVARLVAKGVLRPRRLPGTRAKFYRPQVERLAREALESVGAGSAG
jgi:hypothetical protein